MTDRDKLQQLFQAALQDSTPVGQASLARAYPSAHRDASASVEPLPAAPATPVAVEPAPNPFVAAPSMPAPQAIGQAPFTAVAEVPIPPAPVAEFDHRKTPPPAVLDDAASNELAKVLDEQQARKKHLARRASVLTLLFFVGTSGGAFAWFVQNPDRVQAFKDAMRDIRSVADVKSMVAKYDKALERIQVRSQQIDQASFAMGIDPTKVDENEDPYFEDEMKGMMGSDSEKGGKMAKTVGQRNKMMKDKFGHMEKDHGSAMPKESDPEVAKANAADGFDWKK